MTRANFFKTFLLITMLSIVSTAAAAAQEPAKDAPKPNPDKEALSEEEKENRRAAEQLVSGIEIEVFSDDKWVKVNRIERPLLFFADDTRGITRGSVWAWGDKGRPVATLELFQGGKNYERWYTDFCNTSGGKLRASRDGQPWWLENQSAVEVKDVPQAPAPAAEAPQRQRQLKLLSQKFTGYELWDPNNTRYDLRRIERPVHTYRDEEHGLLEGGLFIIANGTNPEIMLFVEARVGPKDKTKAAWHFSAGRSAYAELHVEYDGKEVFDSPRKNGSTSGPDQPYFKDVLYTKPAAVPKKQ
jgi:hypothetical protein